MKRWSLMLAVFLAVMVGFSEGVYMIGLGRADCTGPSVEIGFMGYAQLNQRGIGIHLRQYCRTFIVDDSESRMVFVSIDAGMVSHAVKREVIRELQKKYGAQYQMDNVMISGTHTHSGPAGFHQHVLYDLTAGGFVRETFNAYVRGITQSIVNAHSRVKEGRIFISETEVNDANINRSPSAYKNNPAQERAQYKTNVDKKLVQLRFMDKQNQKVMGAFNWFAVHPTSMNNTNKFVSSDNVGYASLLLEEEFNNDQVGKGDFVGAFCSTNLGDVSPNIKGPKCQKTGKPCDYLSSSCSKNDECVASGPGRDIFESTKIIGSRIYRGASQLLSDRNGSEVIGSVSSVHQFIEVSKQKMSYLDPEKGTEKKVKGCVAAMGYSFAAGTTDGPGAFDFKQGTTSDNHFWNLVRTLIAAPTPEDIECHGKKPILLATGRNNLPYAWQPAIVPLQVIGIGDVMLFGVPGEFTTMSGRRLRSEAQRLMKLKGKEVQAIVCGLSNSYSSYVTTPEEYDIQRYEGASTIYGPYTLPIYIQRFAELLTAMISNEAVSPGPTPVNEADKQISLTTKVYYDGHPFASGFGYVVTQPRKSYSYNETMTCEFVSGNPRNNLMSDKSFFYVDRLNEQGTWDIVATDADWETKFVWTRVSSILGRSNIEFHWTIPDKVKPGKFRVRHQGFYKHIFGGVYHYQGSTDYFSVE